MAVHKQFQNTTARFCKMQNFKIYWCVKTKQIKVPGQPLIYSVDEKILRFA